MNQDDDLKNIFDHLRNENEITFDKITRDLHTKSIPLLIFICSLPFMQPIPLPGISSVIALVIALQAFAMIFLDRPWLTEKMKKVVITKEKFEIFYSVFMRVNFYIEKLLKPRMRSLFDHKVIFIVSGLNIFFMAILLSLPLPIPFSNFIPAFAITLISLSLLIEDFIFWIIGILWSLMTSVIFALSSKEIAILLNRIFT